MLFLTGIRQVMYGKKSVAEISSIESTLKTPIHRDLPPFKS